MTHNHRKIAHGDHKPARSRARRRKAKEHPMDRKRQAESLMPTELAKAPLLPTMQAKAPKEEEPALRVVDRRSSSSAPAEAAPKADAANHGSEEKLPVAAEAPEPKQPAQQAQEREEQAPAAIGANDANQEEAEIPDMEEAPEAPEKQSAEAEEPQQAESPGGIGLNLLAAENVLTRKTKSLGILTGKLALVGVFCYQAIDNFIEWWNNERTFLDAAFGILSDTVKGLIGAVHSAIKCAARVPAIFTGLALGVLALWGHKNVRDCHAEWRATDAEPMLQRSEKVWRKIWCGMNLAYKLAKTAFVSAVVYHMPHLFAEGSKLFNYESFPNFGDKVKHSIEAFFSNAPLAAYALLAMGAALVAKVVVRGIGGYVKLFNDGREDEIARRAQIENLGKGRQDENAGQPTDTPA